MNIETDFGISLPDIRDRLKALNYFDEVQDMQSLSQVLSGLIPFSPPAAFVAIANETYEGERYAAGGHSQRGTVLVSVTFLLQAERADMESGDEVEQVRRGVLAILRGFQPAGAQKGLEAVRYQPRSVSDGLIIGEWLFRTSYFLTGIRQPEDPPPGP